MSDVISIVFFFMLIQNLAKHLSYSRKMRLDSWILVFFFLMMINNVSKMVFYAWEYLRITLYQNQKTTKLFCILQSGKALQNWSFKRQHGRLSTIHARKGLIMSIKIGWFHFKKSLNVKMYYSYIITGNLHYRYIKYM